MPEGSSSAAPVTNPGPSNRKNRFLGFLGGPEDAYLVISYLRFGSMRACPPGSKFHTADPGVSCWNGSGGRKLQRSPATAAGRRRPSADGTNQPPRQRTA